ncbi:MAG: PucR family transcriptional regulator [Thermoleophilaceae bacterium]
MAITVAELVDVPFVGMRFHAGATGGGRLVTWAHASDLPNALEWLAPGELLMSNGHNVPAEARPQVRFLQELVSAGLSGLAIGDGPHAPELTTEFLERAEKLAFPILAIPHEVPFVAISRAVASANSDEEHRRLVRTAQLYSVFQDGVCNGRLGLPLLAELGDQLGCELVVLDTATSLAVLPEQDEVSPELCARAAREVQGRNGVLPGVLRIREGEAMAFVISVPAARPTVLVALHDAGNVPDLALLQHAANIAALEVERVTAEREQHRALGSDILEQLLEHRLEADFAMRQLRERGIAPETAVVAALQARSGDPQRNCHHELAQRRLAHLAHDDGSRTLFVLAGEEDALDTLCNALGGDAELGVSDPLHRPERMPDAAREASWALSAAESLHRPLVRYGEQTPLFLPRTLGEADSAAKRVLGPLLAYDDEHGTDLIHSLGVFFEENRSWQRSAKRLHVHKQTLVYRMGRVEELTGRSLRDTADVVQLWLALEALQLARGRPHTNGSTPEHGEP